MICLQSFPWQVSLVFHFYANTLATLNYSHVPKTPVWFYIPSLWIFSFSFLGVSFPPSFICQTHTHTSRPSSSIQTGSGTPNRVDRSHLWAPSLICTYLLAVWQPFVCLYFLWECKSSEAGRMTFLFSIFHFWCIMEHTVGSQWRFLEWMSL